jgi:hypothetical protein
MSDLVAEVLQLMCSLNTDPRNAASLESFDVLLPAISLGPLRKAREGRGSLNA